MYVGIVLFGDRLTHSTKFENTLCICLRESFPGVYPLKKHLHTYMHRSVS